MKNLEGSMSDWSRIAEFKQSDSALCVSVTKTNYDSNKTIATTQVPNSPPIHADVKSGTLCTTTLLVMVVAGYYIYKGMREAYYNGSGGFTDDLDDRPPY